MLPRSHAPMVQSMAAGSRHADKVIAESLILIHKQEAGGRATGNETPKTTPIDTLSPTKPHLLILPQAVPLTGGHIFKYISLWGSFSFKPPK